MRKSVILLISSLFLFRCAMTKEAVHADENMYKHHASIKDFVWHNPTQAPFVLEGFPFFSENQNFCRLPMKIMPKQREFLQWVAWQPSGGVVRFVTDAPRFAIRVQLERGEHFPNETIAQESGFDVYLGSGTEKYFQKNLSPEKVCTTYVDECDLPDGLQEVTLYFPLLNPVHSLEIGLPDSALVQAPPAHALGTICFYGSSITQGFTISRPGLTYPAQICRILDAKLVNMGFGGNARGDMDVADAISSLDMIAFILDYDFNSEPEELAEKHEPFFKRFREKHPTTPVIMASAPDWWSDPNFFGRRLAIIEKTYDNALAAGDSAVYLIRGKEFWPQRFHTDCTTDRIHPNDWGCSFMKDRFLEKITKALHLPESVQ